MSLLKSSVVHQYYATYCVNLIELSYGFACGWSSPTFPILESRDSPLEAGPLTPLEISWIVSIMCLGGFLGTFAFGVFVDMFGRKWSLIFLAFPSLLSWFLIIIAKNVYYFYVSRFLIGFCGSGTFIVLPMYVSEISEDRVRGTLSSYMMLCCNIGILIALVLGSYLTYTIAAVIYFLNSILYLIGVCFLPETPFHLMQTGRPDDAEESLAFFRNVNDKNYHNDNEQFKMELEKLRNQFLLKERAKENEVSQKLTFKDFTTPNAVKGILIGTGLMLLNQMSGTFAMMNYASEVFEEAGSSLSPNMSSIIVGIIQLIGSICSTYLCDRSGRIMLLAVSSAGSCFGLTVMGIHMTWFKSDDFNWIPITGFSFLIFICNVGLLTLPFVVVVEIMPEKIRSEGSTICMALLWVFTFISTKYFHELHIHLGMNGCMFLFAASCLIGTIFIVLCIPETKGKSFEEIQESMK